MKVKSPSAVVWPALMPRLSSIVLTIESEPQPPSWQGVYVYVQFQVSFSALFFPAPSLCACVTPALSCCTS